MRLRRLFIFITTTLLQSVVPLPVAAGSLADVPVGPPEATINLATDEGVALVKGQWRYSDTKIIEADFKAPGSDSQPTGERIKTYDYTPTPAAVISTTRSGKRLAQPAWRNAALRAGSALIGTGFG